MFLSQPLPHGRLLDRAYQLPWWIALLGALIAYLFFHPMASLRETAPPEGPFDTLIFGLIQALSLLAEPAQYLIPAILLSLAALNGFLQGRALYLRTLFFQTSGTTLRQRSREEVAFLLAWKARAQGFPVLRVSEPLRKLGFDLELEDSKGTRHLVHLGYWQCSQLGREPVRTSYEQMQTLGRDGLWMLISGRFSPEAIAFCTGRALKLIDGQAFLHLLHPSSTLVMQWLQQAHSFFTQKPRPPQRWRAPAQAPEIRREPTLPPTAPEIPSIRAERRRAPPPESQGPQVLFDPLLTPARLLDWVGMGFSLVLAWWLYQWFNSLPAAPLQDPWARLGSALPPAQTVAHSIQERIRTALRKDPPGQLGRYAPEPPEPEISEHSTPASGQLAEEPTEEPVEELSSLQTLDEAFNARYVPPPDCFDSDAPDSLARCGNHRMRAYRAFIASNGKTLVPSAPQPPAPSLEPSPIDAYQAQAPIPDWRRSYPTQPDSLSWREEQAWREQNASDGWGAVDWDQPVPDLRHGNQAPSDWRHPPPGMLYGRPWWSDAPPPEPVYSPPAPRDWRSPQPPEATQVDPNTWRAEQAWRELHTSDGWGAVDWDQPVPDWRR